MPWRIVPGYQIPAIVISLHDEGSVAQYWLRDRHREASSCRLERPNDPIVVGTKLAGERQIPGTYENTCTDCGKQHWSREPNALWCVGCEIAIQPTREPLVDVPPPWPEPPAIGIHVAGVPVVTRPTWRAARVQRCTQCDAVLGDEHDQPVVPQIIYPVGALIERGRGWQAMSLAVDAAPTCLRIEEPVAVSV